jgi:uncharacterized protein YyaL (SSP411 family)
MDKKEIKHVINWFLNSGIQNLNSIRDSKGSDMTGSFNAWFDPKENTHSYVYTEVSGYALTAFLYLYKETNNKVFLNRAKLIGNWLLAAQHRIGAFPTAFYLASSSVKKNDAFYTFDAGMVLNGLANLYRTTKEQRYLLSVKKVAEWIIKYQSEDGSVSAMVSREDGTVKDNLSTWSSQSGAYHAKLAIGLLNLYDLEHDRKYLKTVQKLCDYSLTFQQSNGQFLTYGELMGTNMHSHVYAAEGLFVAGAYLDELKYSQAAKKAIEWAISLVKNGTVPRHKHDGKLNYNERIDATAQVLRLSKLFRLDVDNREMENNILKYQYFGKNKSQWGGFMFGKLSSKKLVEHINCWVSFFAFQALNIDNTDDFNYFYLI